MKTHDATEQAYKRGYEDGKRDAVKPCINVTGLLPCPFCGGNARISADTEAIRDSQGRLWAFNVVCDRCCASYGFTFSPDRAKEAWNRRADDGK